MTEEVKNEEAQVFEEYLHPNELEEGRAVPVLLSVGELLGFSEAVEEILKGEETAKLFDGEVERDVAIENIEGTLRNAVRASLYAAYITLVAMELNHVAQDLGLTDEEFLEQVEKPAGAQLMREIDHKGEEDALAEVLRALIAQMDLDDDGLFSGVDESPDGEK